MKTILIGSALWLTGCATATPYTQAARSEYVGNNQYEIRVRANERTSESLVRHYLYRKAYVTCAKDQKGFVIVSRSNDNETSSTFIAPVVQGASGTIVNTTLPGASLIIRCEGPVDIKLGNDLAETAKKLSAED